MMRDRPAGPRARIRQRLYPRSCARRSRRGIGRKSHAQKTCVLCQPAPARLGGRL